MGRGGFRKTQKTPNVKNAKKGRALENTHRTSRAHGTGSNKKYWGGEKREKRKKRTVLIEIGT